MRLILVYVVMRENLAEVLPFIDLAKGFAPYRMEFHPVRHVADCVADNGTGWLFCGREQRCESFRNEYDSVMEQAATRCMEESLQYEILRV